MEFKLIVPPNFYIANEGACPPLQFEPFYNCTDIDFIHLKRGDALESIPEAELYGISAYTADIRISDIIAKFLKDRDNKCKIAIGGWHATFRSSEITDNYDFVVVGNGEDFIERIIEDNLPADRICIGSGKKIEFNPRSFKHFARYNPNYHRGSTTSYTLRTSFGCYWQCDFCVGSNRNVLFRDIKDIIFQLSYLYQHEVRNLRIIDEIFTEHPNFTTICALFRPFTWIAQTRLDLLTKEKASIMRKNGCTGIQVGIESFENEVRKKLNKQLSNKQLRTSIKIAKDNDLKLYCFLMLGTPFDTWDTIQKTVEMGQDLQDSSELRPLIFCPFPGTRIGDYPERYNLNILTNEYEYYSTIPFQNCNGRLVSVPGHIRDTSAWESLLRQALYELNTPLIKSILDNPIKEWYENIS